MGSPEFAAIILEDLVGSDICEVTAVFSQPDKPVGRKQILTPCEVSVSAEKLNISLYRPNRLRDSENVEILKLLKPDFIVVAAYGQILSREILDIAPCINFHTSALPRHRGAAALQSLLLADEPYAVVTAMIMDEKLDTGDIIGQLFFKHPSEARFECLLRRLGFLAANMLKEILTNFENIKPLKQIGADASYAKKITKEDGLVTLENAKTLYLKYKAYYPWPGIYLEDGLKIKEVELVESETSSSSGKISVIDGNSAVIECSIGKLKLLKVQPQSKNEMDIGSYLRGKRLSIGDHIL
jgi:methionyl-tRNA formyltransferase